MVQSHGNQVYERAALAVLAPVTSGIFPVQGAYSFGGPDSRFGAAREGHAHQGQDIAAAEGTPVVSPVAWFFAATLEAPALQAGP